MFANGVFKYKACLILKLDNSPDNHNSFLSKLEKMMVFWLIFLSKSSDFREFMLIFSKIMATLLFF